METHSNSQRLGISVSGSMQLGTDVSQKRNLKEYIALLLRLNAVKLVTMDKEKA